MGAHYLEIMRMKYIYTYFSVILQGSGDVKYHLGSFTQRDNHFNKKKIKVAVVANPSHLEGLMMASHVPTCALLNTLSICIEGLGEHMYMLSGCSMPNFLGFNSL